MRLCSPSLAMSAAPPHKSTEARDVDDDIDETETETETETSATSTGNTSASGLTKNQIKNAKKKAVSTHTSTRTETARSTQHARTEHMHIIARTLHVRAMRWRWAIADLLHEYASRVACVCALCSHVCALVMYVCGVWCVLWCAVEGEGCESTSSCCWGRRCHSHSHSHIHICSHSHSHIQRIIQRVIYRSERRGRGGQR